MKLSPRPVIVVVSAAVAALCLLAGRPARPAARPALRPAGAAAVQCAGQAVEQLRRRAWAAACRAARTLLLCLAAPVAALMASDRPEIWVELEAVPGGSAVPRTLRRRDKGGAARPGRDAPPGQSAPSPAHSARAGPCAKPRQAPG